MNSTTNYDILTSIDNMTDMIQESNTNVLESMLNASDKAFMIMESCIRRYSQAVQLIRSLHIIWGGTMMDLRLI